MNWFSQNNLVQSPWTDLKTASNLQAFSIDGDARTFEISGPYLGCEDDSGWLLITQSHCQWETRHPVPSILYSKLSTSVNWNDHGMKNIQRHNYKVYLIVIIPQYGICS